jgi:hypothetical protein
MRFAGMTSSFSHKMTSMWATFQVKIRHLGNKGVKTKIFAPFSYLIQVFLWPKD